MSEMIFELNSKTNIVTQLPKNFAALTFTSEETITSKSYSKSSRLLPVNDGPQLW